MMEFREGETHLLDDASKDPLPQMAEGSVPQIVTQSDGPRKVGIQGKSPADGGRYGRNMHHVFDAGTDMIVLRRKKYLGFMLQPTKRIGMDDSGGIPKVYSPKIHRILWPRTETFLQLFQG